MSTVPIRRALISVYDKTGIVPFARTLIEELGIEVISTGGTAALLGTEGLAVTPVEAVTASPHMMDGRVKTLHPAIHGGILADRSNAEHMRQLEAHGYAPIDLVAVNLYPFKDAIAAPDCTMADAIEMIDIGGPCMMRAAAKNHPHVVVVPDEKSAGRVLNELRHDHCVCEETRRQLAAAAFALVSAYDARISTFLGSSSDELPETISHPALRKAVLRYGENPDQAGAVYAFEDRSPDANLVHVDPITAETEVSFNNYADGHAALELCKELTTLRPGDAVAVFVKHNNPCGVGISSDPVEAYQRAYLGDALAAMGGILAQNRMVDVELATAVMSSLDQWGRLAGAGAFFVEVWIAPAFAPDAIDTIQSAKAWGRRVRMFEVGDMTALPSPTACDIRHITGGLLVQSRDAGMAATESWDVVSRRHPTDIEMKDLEAAWSVCKHTRSNAITLIHDDQLLGNGAGQMSRVMSCRIATWLARENGHEAAMPGAVAASDAFFPFSDGPQILIDAGVRAIAQSGGSKRDADVIALCDTYDVACVMTGSRHFRH
jgi:phosphoribosylaminoimidazolecarboxamide formyltransferase/IMP cyclohydrolase